MKTTKKVHIPMLVNGKRCIYQTNETQYQLLFNEWKKYKSKSIYSLYKAYLNDRKLEK